MAYAALGIDSKASAQQIRDAYKKQALKHHPDRVPADSPERGARTKKFQQINDAYYTLSDPSRRREYDATRVNFFGFGGAQSASGGYASGNNNNRYAGGGNGNSYESAEEEIPRPQPGPSTGAGGMPGGFPWSAFGFGGSAKTEEDANRFSNDQFGSVFEEMMRDEGLADGQSRPTRAFWSLVGAVSGGVMGFIVANVPGAVAGTVAGNRLGAIRDKKGKSVYAVFQELDQNEKMRLLSELASKVFAHAIS